VIARNLGLFATGRHSSAPRAENILF